MSIIIGRKHEQEELDRLYRSNRPEFLAVYGRRRVGKTFLIKQALKDRIVFQHTGVSPVDQEGAKNRMRTQLESFYYSLLTHGLEGFTTPKTWMEAFYQLEQLLIKLDDGNRHAPFWFSFCIRKLLEWLVYRQRQYDADYSRKCNIMDSRQLRTKQRRTL